MALRYRKFVVFFGAYGALLVMTVLSAIFGKVVTSRISPIFTDILVTLLFFIFGLKTIYDSTQHEAEEENDELKEVEIELKEMDFCYVLKRVLIVRDLGRDPLS